MRGMILVLWVLAGCQPSPQIVDTTPPIAEEPVKMLAWEWDCQKQVPPYGGWEQATAFAKTTKANADEKALELATTKLVNGLCTGVSSCCDSLRTKVKGWKAGASGQQVCHMAVVSAEDLATWRQECTSLSGFDEELLTAARDLLQKTALPALPRGGACSRFQPLRR